MRIKCPSENLKGGNHSEDLDVDGRIISELILKRFRMIVNWIRLSYDMVQ